KKKGYVMKHALLALLLALAALPAAAHEYKAGKLAIDHPNALPASQNQYETAGFLRIYNPTRHADRLIGVAAPDVSERREIHIAKLEEPGLNKVATSALDIPARQETSMSLS